MQYLELFRSNFMLLFEQSRHDVIDIIYSKEEHPEYEQIKD